MYYDIPEVDPAIIGWIVKYANQEYSKVKSFMDLEDLIHEGFDCLYDAKIRYPERSPKHFFATVKTMFRRHIPYLLNRNAHLPVTAILDMVEDQNEQDFADKIMGTDEFQLIRTLIAEAPQAIKPILEAFISDKNDVIELLAKPYSKRMDGSRETTNERLCRWLGLDPKRNDIPGELRAFLAEGI